MSGDQLAADLAEAGRVLAAEGLVTAFGHVCARRDATRLVITPPHPLGSLRPTDTFAELDTRASDLPDAAPREAWIHLAVLRARPEAGAVCRAQPPVATSLAAGGVPITPLHGQGALLGPRVPVFDEAELIRDEARARRLADALGPAPAVLMRGNGAVTVGATVSEAVARMWVLEASARMRLTAGVGTPRPLSEREQDAWRRNDRELLARIWAWLRAASAPEANPTGRAS
ncbi:class II aldolase/adducin family protein [Parafrankia sp. EUN1f]|uniref:class II aldolase/adducin family protein n=1 Tax=Parafrankia sp. EUN1f TaxID=102897 RepID=UPI0001C4636C|nr:class II aldolase/adducin family protein [Parafrankia sp. EUN1f]EFC81444.1 class II aldolase/adducin family protein [Parafrankia sp. EUN1f]